MIITIVVLYLTGTVVIGLLSHRKTRSREDFYVAGKSMGLTATTSSLTATGIGGSATIVAAIYVYTRGLPGIWMNLAAGLGLIGLGVLFAGKVRRIGAFSLPEIVGKLYGSKSRLCAAILVVIAEIAWLALVIQALQLILTSVFGINPAASIYISSGLFILYTILGGQFAVSYSDILQSVLMFAGIVLLALIMLFSKKDGKALLSAVPGPMLSFPAGPKMGPLDVISLILLMGLPHMVGPDIYSKILSAKNESVARTAAVLSGMLRMIWGAAVAVIALGAVVMFPDLETPASIFPKIITSVLNPAAGGIIIAALAAAMMSSADTILLTGSTVLAHDVFGSREPGLSDERNQGLGLPRLFVLLIGLLGLALALYLGDIIKTLELAYTVFASGLIIPIIAGFYKEKLKVNECGALASMIGGGAAALVLKLDLLVFLPNLDPILIGMAVSAILLFAFSMICRQPTGDTG